MTQAEQLAQLAAIIAAGVIGGRETGSWDYWVADVDFPRDCVKLAGRIVTAAKASE